MKKSVSLKQRLISSVLTLLLLFSSLFGATFAWFTDSVTNAGNKIQAGNLKIDLLHKAEDTWVSIKENPEHKVFDYDKWEPGFTALETLKVANLGSLALQWRLSVEVASNTAVLGKNGENLADVIDVYVTYGENTTTSYDDITKSGAWEHKGTLTEVMKKPASFMAGQLLPTGEVSNTTPVADQTLCIALHMQESAGNEYQKLSVGDIYVNLFATQWSYENDSFDKDYDNSVTFPDIENFDVVVDVPVENGVVLTTTSVQGEGYSITVPAGVKVNTNKLGASVTEKESSDANLTLGENETMKPLDVHVEGVAEDNTVPIIINLGVVMPTGLNIGNYTLYHVENEQNVAMTLVSAVADLDVHNEFYYDPTNGEVTVAMASFSEVAAVAEPAKWKGSRDYSWYDAAATELAIVNADQLAGLSAIVGGMARINGEGKIYTPTVVGDTTEVVQDSFSGKTVKLLANISIGDVSTDGVDASENGIVFYPIGYWNNEGTYERLLVEQRKEAVSSGFRTFEGTFDGNGHTISDWYQNTWEMKGDHDWYSAVKDQYYRDGMGLFGKVYGGTVKNLTVKNFSSDGEITTTGTIAAYADGATFENIAIFNCNPRVYNIGNGGIVGCVGWYATEAGLKTTFKNITVDNTNKISALWGSWDVACGGLVGQYYPTSGQTSANTPANAGIHMDNCHVSAQIDVYNDVCANYQYYAYRYAGILIGSVRENVTINGYSYPKMDGITANDCTVHFGDWNDYYYCELVANSLASYTHDHQMSRLEQVASVDVENKKVVTLKGETKDIPTSGAANYVVVKEKDANGKWIHGDGADCATCYHFVNGEVWDHAAAGNEVVNGETVLKEDKQLVYREFNNLVTGYGWGVTSKGVGDLAGVTILDREVADSVEKFKFKNDAEKEFLNGSTVTIGELFEAIENAGVAIKSDKVQVFVSPLGETSTAGGTYVANKEDWTQGELTFSGAGDAVIEITDYYFCKTTSITVKVTTEVTLTKGISGTYTLVGEIGEEIITWSAAASALDGVEVRYWSVAKNQYIEIPLSDCILSAEDITNNTWTYTAPDGDFTLTITGEGLKPVVCDNKLYFVVASKDALVRKTESSKNKDITLTYVFTDNNGCSGTFTQEFNATYDSTSILYDYSDFCNGEMKEAESEIGNIITVPDDNSNDIWYTKPY